MLPYRREACRLWFEYLRVARRSLDRNVQEALKRSASFYAPWGDVLAVKFDRWWKQKGQIFEDKYSIRQLAPGERPADSEALIIEIPLRQSPTMLTKAVGEIIREASATQDRQFRKSKKRPTSQYRLTEGAEPKLRAVREMLTVYRDVYAKDERLRGAQLLEKVHAFYLGRKNRRWAKIPGPLLYDKKYGDNAVALRNLRRYISKAKRVVLNVANGEFPGRY
jgi:hypothetical protein